MTVHHRSISWFVWLLLLSFPFTAGTGLAQTREASSCIACHGQLDGEMVEAVAAWAYDVHQEAGLGCVGCHGGDPSPDLADDPGAAMDPGAGFRPVPDRLEVARFCARCHSDADFMKRFDPQARVDQLAEYRTSVHGIRNEAGDPTPATCTDCHGTHGIRPVSSPESPVYAANVPTTCAECHSDAEMMEPYGVPTTQLAAYMKSMHAAALLERGDLAAPACNDCHGNHGATPPGVQSVANVCGQCHGREATLFRASPKEEIFEAMEVAECTVCHDHHEIVHPTPELFHSGSAPFLGVGEIVDPSPFLAEIDLLEPDTPVMASWRVVIRPHTEAEDPGLEHRVEIEGAGIDPIVLDATVRPGDRLVEPDVPRVGTSGPLQATLGIEGLAGNPVAAGDALLLQLDLAAGDPVENVTIRDLLADRLQPFEGSACLTCHSEGDACDLATERMYAALRDLDRE
ncbi:MAG: hypothetical protein GF346_09740, partial [Candidatus Eisenbacteria bacterium]|nr:hypothetical protein [Candidatus Latescibacterota bacterium]MBD3302715.1 hypothetical protein [Candidatus Eisenbacteria bacterium]